MKQNVLHFQLYTGLFWLYLGDAVELGRRSSNILGLGITYLQKNNSASAGATFRLEAESVMDVYVLVLKSSSVYSSLV